MSDGALGNGRCTKQSLSSRRAQCMRDGDTGTILGGAGSNQAGLLEEVSQRRREGKNQPGDSGGGQGSRGGCFREEAAWPSAGGKREQGPGNPTPRWKPDEGKCAPHTHSSVNAHSTRVITAKGANNRVHQRPHGWRTWDRLTR